MEFTPDMIAAANQNLKEMPVAFVVQFTDAEQRKNNFCAGMMTSNVINAILCKVQANVTRTFNASDNEIWGFQFEVKSEFASVAQQELEKLDYLSVVPLKSVRS